MSSTDNSQPDFHVEYTIYDKKKNKVTHCSRTVQKQYSFLGNEEERNEWLLNTAQKIRSKDPQSNESLRNNIGKQNLSDLNKIEQTPDFISEKDNQITSPDLKESSPSRNDKPVKGHGYIDGKPVENFDEYFKAREMKQKEIKELSKNNPYANYTTTSEFYSE